MFIPYYPMLFNRGKGSGGPSSWKDIVILFMICFVVAWFFITLLLWLFPIGEQKKLLDVLQDQYRWLISLKIW